ncbi:MAG: ribonuclease toxin HepT-like protein [Nitrospirota bacterium]
MPNRQLREQCEAEFENIDAVVAELFLLAKPEKSEYSVAELAAMATFLHNFYNGVENIFKRILYAAGAELKNSPTWHKELLLSTEAAGIISNDLCNTLSNYLSFRHYFVHAYSFTLRWEELRPLVSGVAETLAQVKSAAKDFVNR